MKRNTAEPAPPAPSTTPLDLPVVVADVVDTCVWCGSRIACTDNGTWYRLSNWFVECRQNRTVPLHEPMPREVMSL